jgi:hypothetical protein
LARISLIPKFLERRRVLADLLDLKTLPRFRLTSSRE